MVLHKFPGINDEFYNLRAGKKGQPIYNCASKKVWVFIINDFISASSHFVIPFQQDDFYLVPPLCGGMTRGRSASRNLPDFVNRINIICPHCWTQSVNNTRPRGAWVRAVRTFRNRGNDNLVNLIPPLCGVMTRGRSASRDLPDFINCNNIICPQCLTQSVNNTHPRGAWVRDS